MLRLSSMAGISLERGHEGRTALLPRLNSRFPRQQDFYLVEGNGNKQPTSFHLQPHRHKNKRRSQYCVGWVFLSSSHPHPAHLSFPGHYQHISNASKMLIKQLDICQLLHRTATRLNTEPSHLCMEQKPDIYPRHPQLFSTNTKNPANPTGSLKVHHPFPVA